MFLRFMFVAVFFSSAACGGQITGDDSGTKTNDASTTNDAGIDSSICLDIEPANFTTSCAGDTDCIGIASGTICSGPNLCLCPTASISASAESQYQAKIASLEQGGGCGCPLLGTPHCITSQCVFCPNPEIQQSIPPGCPDGGN